MNNKISFACSPAMLAALLLGGCTIKPPSTDVMMGSIASQPQEERSLSPLLTSGDFCVAVSQQKVLAQPCSGKDDQLFDSDTGFLGNSDSWPTLGGSGFQHASGGSLFQHSAGKIPDSKGADKATLSADNTDSERAWFPPTHNNHTS